MKKRIVAVVVILLLAVSGYLLYGYYTGNQEENGLSLSGTVEAAETQVSTLVAGRITATPVKEGDAVKNGALLVTLDPSVLKEQRAQAAAGVQVAAADLETARDDEDDDAVDAATAKLKAAKAVLGIADVQLGYARITAPIAGTVLDLPATVGEYASPGNALVTIGDLNALELTVYVPEEKFSKVRLGQTVTVTTDSYPSEKFNGKVTRIASEAEFTPTNTETKEQRVKLVYAVKLGLGDGGGKLKPGMPADAEFSLE